MSVVSGDVVGNSTNVDPLYLAVGVPGGYVADLTSSNNGNQSGAIRCGGEIVFLNAHDYWVWTVVLNPMPLSSVNQLAVDQIAADVRPVLDRLSERSLVLAVGSWDAAGAALGLVKPIPLGYALGNVFGDATQFQLQDAARSQASAVTLNPIESALWWHFDGSTSVREAVTAVAARVPAAAADAVETVAIGLVLRLMRQRLLYLDAVARAT